MCRGLLRKVFVTLEFIGHFGLDDLREIFREVFLGCRDCRLSCPVCVLVRSLVHRRTGKSERNSDSILHKHKCTFFFQRQAVYMVAVTGTSEARPRGDPENGPESEAGALHRTYLVSTDSS